ncbi:MAG: hypothetical protein Q3972_09300, partial [Corynebacterium sp.]|nr:hypothetical protein [Corynebacterium sp.]
DSAQQDTAQQDTVQLTVLQADATDLELLPTAFGITAGEQGTVEPFLDLFLSNPPYVPESSWVDEETKQDPHMAVFGGDDGMSLMPALFQQANRYLRAGGALMIEHDDTTGEAMRTLAAQYPRLSEIETVQDYTQRDRFLRALVRV